MPGLPGIDIDPNRPWGGPANDLNTSRLAAAAIVVATIVIAATVVAVVQGHDDAAAQRRGKQTDEREGEEASHGVS